MATKTKKGARSKMPPQTREHVAHHEAGHFVAAYFLGRSKDILTVTIRPSGDAAGANHGDSSHPLQEGASVGECSRLVVELYAAYAAEVGFDPSRETAARMSAAADDEMADGVLRLICRAKERDAWGREMRAAADALIKEHWPCATALARDLLEHDTIEGYEAACIVAIAEGERARAELAGYRAKPAARAAHHRAAKGEA